MRTSGLPPNRSRTIAMATTPPAAAPKPCSRRNTLSQHDVGRERGGDGCRDVQRRGEDERQAAADLVAPRADDELAEAEADHGAGERELHGRGGDAELVLQHGERRQVEVDRERAERRERAEHEHVDEALAAREEVAGVRDGRVVVGPDDGDGGGGGHADPGRARVRRRTPSGAGKQERRRP